MDNVEFQSTHPHGVRQAVEATIAGEGVVSIHAPTRGATNQRLIADFGQQFQSTHPHGVRPALRCWPSRKSSFNPRTHTGCDLLRRVIDGIIPFVSIHAPTRGATHGGNRNDPYERVSIHAPTRGATKLLECTNPVKGVSIHAPTRGATHQDCGGRTESRVSIHAPTRGATLRNRVTHTNVKFQSTHPHGVRLLHFLSMTA